jgi:hypothetical protein
MKVNWLARAQVPAATAGAVVAVIALLVAATPARMTGLAR